MLGRRILPRVGLNHSAAIVLQKVVFYVLVLVFTLFALNMVNVPLTIFTLLGGAIAIGIGFGAQNMFNNFISGWILLAERPVRIGDLVKVEGAIGHVRAIGARCTRIRRTDGIDMLVPNSLMLERTVVNWTLTDQHIRTTVRVGVIYGSPTELVAKLIQRVADEDERILKDPDPVIIFDDFGDSSLVFDLYFWVVATTEMQVQEDRSDVRFRIDQLFRAAEIVIAFPQRDVHLDTTGPLDVRMVESPQDDDTRALPPADPHTDRAALLRQIVLFESLSSEEITTLSASLDERHFPAGRDVVRQGEAGASLFVVVKGLLEINVKSHGHVTPVGKLLVPGHFFGEMSLLTGEARSATVTAVTDTTIYELGDDMLAPILKARPEVVKVLSAMLAERRSLTSGQTVRRAERSPDESNGRFAADLRRRIRTFFGLSP